MQTPEPIANSHSLPQPAALQLELASALERVRPAAQAVQRFLQEQGCKPEEIMDCELALVEACNNAIQYAAPEAGHQPVRLEVLCLPQQVELRITDHSQGFAWPERAVLPGPESEHGRGVYLIQSLMDETRYQRQPQGNMLVLRKRRKT